ncbi:hypothetical protein [Aeromicrobium stalagmiti]|uniref:hypothetical protein n=1 Tax=Aeromicrobium stalagmiti TaxID=2738988 RepID=UPI0015686106|nr:hypothetical protein [Aeromicrobium stalagmiti]NRQ48513.1 hypothetical protein [Aeromicrobium stalagmiti]
MWVVAYVDPEHPDDILVGGAIVVTDNGAVHTVGSIPDALDALMMALGATPETGDAW